MAKNGYSKLIVERVGWRKYKLVSHWKTPYGTIPAGGVVNGANIPRILWWFDHPEGVLFEASVFHDFYLKHGHKTKEYADKSFKQIALDFGVSKLYSEIAYWCVKLFGRGNY